MADDVVKRLGPSAEAFAAAVIAEKKGFAGIRFQNAIVIFCMDEVEGSEILRTAFEGLIALNEKTAIKEGDMRLAEKSWEKHL